MKYTVWISCSLIILIFNSCKDKDTPPGTGPDIGLFFQDDFSKDLPDSIWKIQAHSLDKVEIKNGELMIYNEPSFNDLPVIFLKKDSYNKDHFTISFDFISAYDSIAHRFFNALITSPDFDPDKSSILFALTGNELALDIDSGRTTTEYKLNLLPKGRVWYTMSLSYANETLTGILRVKDGSEMGKVALKYPRKLSGYWGFTGQFYGNDLNTKSMVYFDNFKITP